MPASPDIDSPERDLLVPPKPRGIADLLRHGGSEQPARFCGSRDEPLSEAGWAQMWRAIAADQAAGRADWDRIQYSPSRRCAEFALALADRLELEAECHDNLRERHFGDWEGMAVDQVPVDDLIRLWAAPLDFAPPNAEPLGSFLNRISAFWDQLSDQNCRRPLIITHGGVIRGLIGHALGVPVERLLLIDAPCACRSRLSIPDWGCQSSLIAHNLSS